MLFHSFLWSFLTIFSLTNLSFFKSRSKTCHVIGIYYINNFNYIERSALEVQGWTIFHFLFVFMLFGNLKIFLVSKSENFPKVVLETIHCNRYLLYEQLKLDHGRTMPQNPDNVSFWLFHPILQTPVIRPQPITLLKLA